MAPPKYKALTTVHWSKSPTVAFGCAFGAALRFRETATFQTPPIIFCHPRICSFVRPDLLRIGHDEKFYASFPSASSIDHISTSLHPHKPHQFLSLSLSLPPWISLICFAFVETQICCLCKDELDQSQDPPLQCHDGALYARLVGALPLQYADGCVALVHLLQCINLCYRVLQQSYQVKALDNNFCEHSTS